MGAKVIYKAKIEKQSAQKLENPGDRIQHPWDDTTGDLIRYYNHLPGMNAHHSRSVAVKASCTVNLGIEVVKGNETQVMDRLANVNEDGESFFDVLNRVALDYEITANGFLECVKSKGGTVEELYFCPAGSTFRTPRGSETAFLYQGDTGNTPFARFNLDDLADNSLVHFMQPSQFNRHYGIPDWRGIIPEIELDYYSSQYTKGFFINGGMPDLAIIVEGGEFDEETEKKVVEFIQQNFKGLENSHRTLYLPINDSDVKVKFERIAPDNEWSYPIEKMRDSSRDRILSSHGVPPRLAGVVTAGQLGGGSEVEGQLKIFQELTISPRQRYFEPKINQVLKAMGLNAEIKLKGIDLESYAQVAKETAPVETTEPMNKSDKLVLLNQFREVVSEAL